jgi:hypothetical protein
MVIFEFLKKPEFRALGYRKSPINPKFGVFHKFFLQIRNLLKKWSILKKKFVEFGKSQVFQKNRDGVRYFRFLAQMDRIQTGSLVT